MAEWNKSKVLPSAINGGQEFTTKDNLAINELNAIVNNSFYASEISEISIAKADSAVATSKLAEDKIDNFIKTEGNSVVTLNGVPQVTWSADFAESERQKSKNLLPLKNRLEQTSQGISYARRFDGAIVLYGANEGVANSSYAVATNFTLKAGTYTTSVRGATGVDLILTDDVRYLSGTFTLNEDTSFTLAYIQVPASNTTFFNQVPIWLQVEEGSVVTEWQYPYGAIVHEEEIADVEHIETIYDMLSPDESINLGDTGGIQPGATISNLALSKYKTLRIWFANYGLLQYQSFLTLSIVGNGSRECQTTSWNSNYQVTVNKLDDTSSITNLSGDDNRIWKIEGVY